LPLLFFIAGVGTHFSLAKRSIGAFAGERTLRLLIPLAFAMFFTIPFQVYFEWLQEGRITGSYAKFYPQVWNLVPFPEGAFTWSHMWFVVYLYVFTILLLPIFALFKIKFLERVRRRIANAFSNPLAAALLFVPLSACYFTLFARWPEQLSLVDDWFVFVFSLIFVVYGYMAGASEKFWNTCQRYRYAFLTVAAICIAFLYYRFWWDDQVPKKNGQALYLYGTLNAVHIWFLILAILGFAKQHLNIRTKFLVFANEAVYPFYILHQTIIVAAGYYIVQLPMGIAPKLIILVLVTFVSLVGIYRYLIRPFVITRILYGLKARKKTVVKLQEEPV
jgi:hypothetical protein